MIKNFHVFNYLFILGILNTMALLMLLGDLMCNALLAWAMLQQSYVSKTLSLPPPQNKNNWVHSVISRTSTENSINTIIIQNNIIFGFPTLFARFSICG